MGERVQFVSDRREEKFPLAADLWDRVVRCAEQYLPIERFDGVHSLVNLRTTYLDTTDLESYREYLEARPVRKKIRIRQYGYDGRFNGRCWVEIKIKQYDNSLKRRFCCHAEALMDMMSGRDILSHVQELNAHHTVACKIYEAVRSFIVERSLRPFVRVDYERISFQAGGSQAGRITVDRRVRFRTAHQSMTKAFEGTVLEVKYREKEPDWLGEFLRDLALLEPSRFSKYARAVRDLGFDGRRKRDPA